MTTYTVVFPHREDTPISVLRHIGLERCTYDVPPLTYHASLASVLRLIRLSTNKPCLVPHPSGVALEIVVDKPSTLDNS